MCSKNVKSFYPYLVERKNIGFLRLSSSPLRFQEQQGETSGLFKHDCAMVCLLVTKLGLWHLCVIHFETSSIFTKYIKHCKMGFFLISVTLRWHSGVKSHEIWTFKVNCLCQKMSRSFHCLSLKNINLGPHFLISIFFLIISILK